MHALPSLDAPRMERLLPRRSDAAVPARRSAVERLAADRAKYVRGLPGAAGDPAPEGSSPGTGEGPVVDPRPPACAPGAVARRTIARKPLRPDSLVMYRQKCEFVRGPSTDSFGGGLVRKLLPGSGKEKTSAPPEKSAAGGEAMARGEEAAPTKPNPAVAPGPPERPCVAAATTARPCVPAATPAPPARPSVPAAAPAPPARPSVPAAAPEPPARPSVPAATPAPPARPSVPAAAPAPPARPSVPAAAPAPPARPSVPAAAPAPPARPSVPAATPAPPERPSVPAATPVPPVRHRGPAGPGSPEPRVTRRRGLQRSQSDLSSRYSMSAAEFDNFFQFCGLEPEVVEALGRENFSAGSDRLALKIRSVSMATSDSGFSRHSGSDEGLQEEELMEQLPSSTSVVERNARIIKWLYTCKKAKETLGPRLQGLA
ncbi:protein FAM110C [Phyllostomus hastatus]|uniref:protein FAM110C n=1 Tax=Phyllostomus hastatus TaxID=9423 RepID=UPI001E682959|nr:protein FAM110C [Phyllostomus hastatus]